MPTPELDKAIPVLDQEDSNVDSVDSKDNTEEKVKLTDWANEPTVADLKQDLIDATSDQDAQNTKVETWLDNLNITGKAKRKKAKGRSNIVPKLIRKQAEWRYAALSEPFLSTDDIFNTDPVTFEDRQAAIENALVLNNQFNTKIQKVKFIDDYIRTAVDEGTVIIRVGWDFEEEDQEVEVPDFKFEVVETPEAAQMQEELMQLMETEPERYAEEVPQEMQDAHDLTMENGVPYMPVQVGTKIETQAVTVKNQPTVEVCDFRNVTIDPTCLGNLKKAGFVIFSFDTSLSELEKDGKYSNLDQINADANSILGDPDYASADDVSFNFTDKPRKKFVAHEYWGYWDIDNSGMTKPFVGTWVGDTMIQMDLNPFPDQEVPFVTVPYLPVRRSIFGEPDGELLEDNQKIIGAVTRGMIDIMGRSANGQVGSRKDALDTTNRRKFNRGLDYEYNAQVNPVDAFYTHTYPEIPRSASEMIAMQNSEAESLTGIKAFYSGISGDALGTTATGVRSAMDATSKRELGILRRLAEGMKEIGRKFISMNGEFLSDEEIIRITNEEFVSISRENLAGDFDINLTISTAEADNEKAQELAFMLQTMGNNMDPGMSQLILADIARLRKMPTLAKQIDTYEPQPDPIAEQIKQLEVAKLQAEIAKIQSETEENQSDATLNLAKAGETQSSKDMKDLDFVEQESGVNQEREIEKLGEQARGNMRLKAVEQSLKNDGERIKQAGNNSSN